MFYEQAVCKRNTKTEKNLLYEVGQYDGQSHADYISIKRTSLIFKEQRQKRIRKDYWDCHI